MQAIVVDAIGGDHAPKAEVEGAIRAVRGLDVKVVLVGQEGVIRQELAQYEDYRDLPIEIAHAPRSEEHTSELQSLRHLVWRLLLEKKKNNGDLLSQFLGICVAGHGSPIRTCA